MITNVDPQTALFLTDVQRIQDRISRAGNQVSSGLKITVASDAPDQIGARPARRAQPRQEDPGASAVGVEHRQQRGGVVGLVDPPRKLAAVVNG